MKSSLLTFLGVGITLLPLFTGCRPEGAVSPAESKVEETLPLDRLDKPPMLTDPTAVSESDEPAPATPTDAAVLLQEMISRYRVASSYADYGFIRVLAPDGREELAPCTVAFQKPNRIRIELFNGYLVGDGSTLLAQTPLFAMQVLELPSPPVLTLANLYPDYWLAMAMRLTGPVSENNTSDSSNPPGKFWVPPQLLLLFASNPFHAFVPEGTALELLAPEKIQETLCDRIRIFERSVDAVSPGSETTRMTLWIDRQKKNLLRVDYPATEEGVLCQLELVNAMLGADFSSEAFLMEQPVGAEHVKKIDPMRPAAETKEADGPPGETARMAEAEPLFWEQFTAARLENRFAAQWPIAEPEPSVVIPERRLPGTLQARELWKITGLPMPGNILVIPKKDGAVSNDSSELLLPFGGNRVARIDAAGKVLQQEKPESVDDREFLSIVRLGGTPEKPILAAGGLFEKTIHLFDSSLQGLGKITVVPESEGSAITDFLVTTWPIASPPGAETTATGEKRESAFGLFVATIGPEDDSIPDKVRLYALDFFEGGEGTDQTGLRIQEVWTEEKATNPYRLGCEGQVIYVMNAEGDRGTILRLDRTGKQLGAIASDDGNPIGWFTVGSPSTAYPFPLAALVPRISEKAIDLVGLDPDGRKTWSHPFPVAVHRTPIEQIVEGDLVGDAEPEWVAASADGTIHIVTRDGMLIDRFVYGRELTGIAVARFQGKRVLIVADTETVTAWACE